ncbi:3-hydroxyacyl-ACP dehydratase FabZ [Paenibacillus oenotherae]|uniref:3-hydroxyacyl-ACP dehydratase FabZ n=1 Tax=Paenibacillus oenotherae TaxID=1435645 RepID=A0ABS7DAN5_9BACL|nr:3-hydroxyacyl-ACP dehydratase FabZ [Paenibacillus oenotherae]MBW7476950.1 3-hydroxyacyl-ACP dehydratase FabZ [Paenibacillus oenotherae]
MKTKYSFDEVKEMLPQAYPFVLIDTIENIAAGESIVCLKNISGNEWMFPGHFPSKAIYPGVLLNEGMAQACILLFKISRPELDDPNTNFYLTAVKSRFLKPVVPGDQVRYVCKVLKMVGTGGIVEAEAVVDGTIVAKAELTFAAARANAAISS